MCEGTFYATGTSAGNIKTESFKDYISDMFKKKEINVDKSIEEMKKQGLPVEDN